MYSTCLSICINFNNKIIITECAHHYIHPFKNIIHAWEIFWCMIPHILDWYQYWICKLKYTRKYLIIVGIIYRNHAEVIKMKTRSVSLVAAFFCNKVNNYKLNLCRFFKNIYIFLQNFLSLPVNTCCSNDLKSFYITDTDIRNKIGMI